MITAAPTTETRPAELRAFMEHALDIGADVTVSVKTAAELAAVLGVLGSHNDYDHVAASKALGPLVAEMMDVKVEHFVSGPALHFHLPHWTHQAINAGPYRRMGERIDMRSLAERVRQVGKQLNADEVSCVQMNSEHDWRGTGVAPIAVRLWWD